MQKILYQTADAGDTLSDSLFIRQHSADAEVSLSDSGCRTLSIRQRTQETLYQTADVKVSFRQRMQEPLYQTADAEVSLSDSGCRRHSIRQRMQESLFQTADAGVSLCVS